MDILFGRGYLRLRITPRVRGRRALATRSGTGAGPTPKKPQAGPRYLGCFLPLARDIERAAFNAALSGDQKQIFGGIGQNVRATGTLSTQTFFRHPSVLNDFSQGGKILMTHAVCFKCGEMKWGAFNRCGQCQAMPRTDDELMSSLAFTDHHFEPDKLQQMSQSIKNGETPQLTNAWKEQLAPAIEEVKRVIGIGRDARKVLPTSKRHLLNGGAAVRIGWAAARIIGSVGAFVSAAMLSPLVSYLQFAFFDLVMPPWETSSGSEPASHFAIPPLFLNGDPRLDVVCAVVIPTIIVLWSRKAAAPIRRIRAWLIGASVSFIPIAIQIITWPFAYGSYQGVRAIAAVALFATVVLSIYVTRRELKIDFRAGQILSTHIRRGLLRLYLVVSVPWIAWWVYDAYSIRGSIHYNQTQMNRVLEYEDRLERSPTDSFPLHELSLMRTVWEVNSNDELRTRIVEEMEQGRDNLTTSIFALLGAAFPPLLMPLAAGFSKRVRE